MNNLRIFLLTVFFLNPAFALVNRYGNFDSSNYRIYKPDRKPSKDLVRITQSQASTLSKSWLEDMMIEIITKEKEDRKLERLPKKLFEITDAHVVTSINQLENYISYHRSDNDIYLSWCPMSNKKNRIPLFIVVAELNTTNMILSIKQLVQSPKWDPRQIPSSELKEALNDYTSNFDNCMIDLGYLYEHDLRYKLSWSIWNITYNQ